MKKHYYILGLKEGASQEEIQEAYERLSKELDPANNDNQEFFIEEFKKVQEAYKALSNTSILATDKGAKQIFKKPSSTSKNNNSTKTPIAESPRKSSKLLFIILGILFLVAIALSYVFLQPIDKNSLIEENIKGDVKLLSEYSFVAIEKFGDAIKGEMKRENYETDYRNIYNEKGNIIEESNYETDGVFRKTIYKYDGNENKIETNNYYADGTLGVNSTSVFDDKGNEIKSSLFIGSEFLGYFNSKYDKKYIVLVCLAFVAFFTIMPFAFYNFGLTPEKGSWGLILFLSSFLIFGLTFNIIGIMTRDSMLGDISDEVELETGKRQEGILYAAVSFMQKVNSGLGSFTAGMVLTYIGFKGSQSTSDEVYSLIVVQGPVVACLLIIPAFMVYRYKITRERHAEIIGALKASQ